MTKTRSGYVLVWKPSHPNAMQNGWILAHRFEMSKAIGRALAVGEVVHHINGNKTDNRIENLLLLKSQADHRRLHKKRKEEIIKCSICGRPQRCKGLCREHYNKARYVPKPRRIKEPKQCAFCGCTISRLATRCTKCKKHDPRYCAPCTVCGKPQVAKGLCKWHYAKLNCTVKCAECGKVITKSSRKGKCAQRCKRCQHKPKFCMYCKKPQHARLLCRTHYKKWRQKHISTLCLGTAFSQAVWRGAEPREPGTSP